MNNIDIAFYSHSGVTKKAARQIHAIIGSDIIEVLKQHGKKN